MNSRNNFHYPKYILQPHPLFNMYTENMQPHMLYP